MATGRDKSGRWVKGHSGNISGYPKENPDVKALLKAHTLDAAQKVIDLLDCGIEKIELQAAQEILNRVEGKPRDNVQMNVSGSLDVRSQVREIMMERMVQTPEVTETSAQWIAMN